MKTFDYAQFIELTRSHEQRNLEYKDSFSWDKSISDIQARTIRAIISMANIPDGGKVIIGIKEKNSNIVYTGLTQIQKDTFKDIDKIKSQIDGYIHQYVDFDIYVTQDEKDSNKWFVIIDVKEAKEYPLLTKKELKLTFGDHTEKYIESNVIYSRSLAGDNSSEKISQNELNEILNHSFRIKQSLLGIEQSAPLKDDTSQSVDLSGLLSIAIKILSTTRLYDQKHGETLSSMKSLLKIYGEELERFFIEYEEDIDKILQKDIQQILESIDRANNHRMMLGAESWNEYKGYIESVITVSNNIIEYFKSKNLNLSNIDEETKKQLKYIFNWLKKFDDFKYKEYLYTSSSFAEIVYQLGYYYSFIDNNISSTLLNMGDTFTKHSMGLTNTDYVTVKKEIPEMVKEINKLLTK
ncbi:MAG TPA: ATP-binding protein [Candidatus Dojkabacteria bacterium]|nr:ATP-binding protein [Candidatus Dojkabacteria bacterium]